MKVLLKLPILTNKSNELFQNIILKKILLGSPEWDKKIKELLLKIIKLDSVRVAGMDTLEGFLTASFVEEKIANSLIEQLNAKSNKEYVQKVLEKELVEFIVESKGLNQILESDKFKRLFEK